MCAAHTLPPWCGWVVVPADVDQLSLSRSSRVPVAVVCVPICILHWGTISPASHVHASCQVCLALCTLTASGLWALEYDSCHESCASLQVVVLQPLRGAEHQCGCWLPNRVASLVPTLKAQIGRSMKGILAFSPRYPLCHFAYIFLTKVPENGEGIVVP